MGGLFLRFEKVNENFCGGVWKDDARMVKDSFGEFEDWG